MVLVVPFPSEGVGSALVRILSGCRGVIHFVWRQGPCVDIRPCFPCEMPLEAIEGTYCDPTTAAVSVSFNSGHRGELLDAGNDLRAETLYRPPISPKPEQELKLEPKVELSKSLGAKSAPLFPCCDPASQAAATSESSSSGHLPTLVPSLSPHLLIVRESW